MLSDALLCGLSVACARASIVVLSDENDRGGVVMHPFFALQWLPNGWHATPTPARWLIASFHSTDGRLLDTFYSQSGKMDT
uniref:Putative secreted protein n=1 Tax=Anopheles marajoara TaxID=58244 RepID=A0A2M4CC44_9DIPT